MQSIRVTSMEDLVAELRAEFEKPLTAQALFDCSAKLQDDYRASLKSSNISMLPSYQHTLPTGRERGDYLALDVGGSTFRIALIRLGGKGEDNDGLQVRRLRSFTIDESVRRLSGLELFDWMAHRIGCMLSEYNYINRTTNARLQMGLAWSFPVEQTSLRTGRLLMMGKGFSGFRDLEGMDLGELLMNACQARDLNVELRAIVNDSAAALTSQAYRDSATRMSLIYGTGVNAAVFLPVSAVGTTKFGDRPERWHRAAKRILVNAEMSMFGKSIFVSTRWDQQLNNSHSMPDFQPLEYLIGGRYLGEIVRLVIIEATAKGNLFNGRVPKGLDEPYGLDTRILGAFESDSSPDLHHASAALLSAHPSQVPPSLQELKFIRTLTTLISERATAYLATAIHALWAVQITSESLEPGSARPITVACDGSMIEKYPGFRERAQRYLDQLCTLSGAAEGAVMLEMAPESSIFGAAVSASCSD